MRDYSDPYPDIPTQGLIEVRPPRSVHRSFVSERGTEVIVRRYQWEWKTAEDGPEYEIELNVYDGPDQPKKNIIFKLAHLDYDFLQDCLARGRGM